MARHRGRGSFRPRLQSGRRDTALSRTRRKLMFLGMKPSAFFFLIVFFAASAWFAPASRAQNMADDVHLAPRVKAPEA